MNNIASPFHRIVAYLIDVLIMSLSTLFLVFLISLSSDTMAFFNNLLYFSVLLIIVYPILYIGFVVWIISKFGGTPGKLLTGIAIVNSKGGNINYKIAFFRNYIGYIISGILFWVGFFWVFVDKERRTWHDQIADTYVIVKNKMMIFVGLLILIAVLILNVYLTLISVRNFEKNGQMYSEIFPIFNEETTPTPIPLEF